MVRRKVSPSPLSHVSVTGLAGVRTAPSGADHTVFGWGSLTLVPAAATHPWSAKKAPGVLAGDSSVMIGLPGSTVTWYFLSLRSSSWLPLKLMEPERLAVSIGTRGVAAIAASRVRGCPSAPG